MLLEGADGMGASTISLCEPLVVLEDVVVVASPPLGDAAVSDVMEVFGDDRTAVVEVTLRDENEGCTGSEVCEVGMGVDEGVMVVEDEGWMAMVESDKCDDDVPVIVSSTLTLLESLAIEGTEDVTAAASPATTVTVLDEATALGGRPSSSSSSSSPAKVDEEGVAVARLPCPLEVAVPGGGSIISQSLGLWRMVATSLWPSSLRSLALSSAVLPSSSRRSGLAPCRSSTLAIAGRPKQAA